MPLNLLRNSGILSGFACMLSHYGWETSDMDIAKGMELGFLMDKEGDHFLSGLDLCMPRWTNLYLSSHGYKLIRTDVKREELLEHLSRYPTSMLLLRDGKKDESPYVFLEKVKSRYRFVSTIPPKEGETPSELLLTALQLSKRVEDVFVVCNIVPCPVQKVDMAEHLLHSVDVLQDLFVTLQPLFDKVIPHDDLYGIYDRLVRPLTVGGAMMAGLNNDRDLYARINRLRTNYLSIMHGWMSKVRLSAFIHPEYFQQCVIGLQENIFDRLYELGVPDSTIDKLAKKCVRVSETYFVPDRDPQPPRS